MDGGMPIPSSMPATRRKSASHGLHRLAVRSGHDHVDVLAQISRPSSPEIDEAVNPNPVAKIVRAQVDQSAERTTRIRQNDKIVAGDEIRSGGHAPARTEHEDEQHAMESPRCRAARSVFRRHFVFPFDSRHSAAPRRVGQGNRRVYDTCQSSLDRQGARASLAPALDLDPQLHRRGDLVGNLGISVVATVLSFALPFE